MLNELNNASSFIHFSLVNVEMWMGSGTSDIHHHQQSPSNWNIPHPSSVSCDPRHSSSSNSLPAFRNQSPFDFIQYHRRNEALHPIPRNRWSKLLMISANVIHTSNTITQPVFERRLSIHHLKTLFIKGNPCRLKEWPWSTVFLVINQFLILPLIHSVFSVKLLQFQQTNQRN